MPWQMASFDGATVRNRFLMQAGPALDYGQDQPHARKPFAAESIRRSGGAG